MLGIVLVVFLAAFAIAMLALSVGARQHQQARQTAGRLASVVTAAPDVHDDSLDLRKLEVLSSIPWLDRWLTRIGLFPRLRLLLYQADLNWTVGALLLTSIACGALAAYAVNWRTGTVALSVFVGLLAGWAPFAFIFYKRSHRFTAFERMLPDALDLIVGALRAGHSLTSTIGMVSREMSDPIAREFRKCFDEQMFGIETRTAMLSLVARVPIQPVRIIATAILVQKESGGNLAEVLDKTGYVIRERFKLQRQVSVHTAQGRLTGVILAILPVLLGFGIYLANPDHFSLLWKRPVGLKMLYGSVIMTCIGALIIRKIVRIRV